MVTIAWSLLRVEKKKEGEEGNMRSRKCRFDDEIDDLSGHLLGVTMILPYGATIG